jgi:hypothetical protein
MRDHGNNTLAMTYREKSLSRINRNILQVAALLFLAAITTPVAAEIFRYTDARGRAIFTDHAISEPHCQLVWRSSGGGIDFSWHRAPHSALTFASNSRRGGMTNKRRRAAYAALIAQAAHEARVSADLLHAVVQAESAYNPKAHSRAGAIGLMQLMPATARRYGVTDIWDPVQNLSGGAHYLRDLLDMFANNLRLALAAYNAGEGAVIQNGNQIPPYPETREYVRRVIGNFKVQLQQSNS